ncbi:hypothetical protein TWF718_007834 [Orbilia javanica]|uniref:Jacalin-type lectin domain-containing protein n=1 Tax=Orbilia javanica TaxID=47235 RepID=A0AAN8RBY6_9PEZI
MWSILLGMYYRNTPPPAHQPVRIPPFRGPLTVPVISNWFGRCNHSFDNFPNRLPDHKRIAIAGDSIAQTPDTNDLYQWWITNGAVLIEKNSWSTFQSSFSDVALGKRWHIKILSDYFALSQGDMSVKEFLDAAGGMEMTVWFASGVGNRDAFTFFEKAFLIFRARSDIRAMILREKVGSQLSIARASVDDVKGWLGTYERRANEEAAKERRAAERRTRERENRERDEREREREVRRREREREENERETKEGEENQTSNHDNTLKPQNKVEVPSNDQRDTLKTILKSIGKDELRNVLASLDIDLALEPTKKTFPDPAFETSPVLHVVGHCSPGEPCEKDQRRFNELNDLPGEPFPLNELLSLKMHFTDYSYDCEDGVCGIAEALHLPKFERSHLRSPKQDLPPAEPRHGHAERIIDFTFNPGEYLTGYKVKTSRYGQRGDLIIGDICFVTSEGRQVSGDGELEQRDEDLELTVAAPAGWAIVGFHGTHDVGSSSGYKHSPGVLRNIGPIFGQLSGDGATIGSS